ncbi:class I SAM-dependent methyltransferase [Paraburkholderia megapolitana]|uniref:Methyltransferase domain-containing protein n=1 Tax=Paraburkholderia megapolitana TaxID=420953 RepID=A0A1I3R543_9BURK|nr:class I SAM-dependent methyltransferase [Paraburkholderia megapolitana]QDQ83680.1 class I SAM-dependent methyltransferase [Paraburkholderia megapolitana]SFJ40872.1 Methyltransferase domain-containing protein [Paraburkholderia megapolitana]
MQSLPPAEDYLQDFHQRFTGATSAAFGHLPAHSNSAAYTSSYHVLASRVDDSSAARVVVDLGCGDGYLLKLLADRELSAPRLIGVDMSQHELDAARKRLPDNVSLLRERAQSLSIETGTVDIVLSHMAVMLMGEADRVVAEIRRILRPGGVFAAIVGREFLLGEANDALREVFRPVALNSLAPLAFGDRRTRDEAGWRELLGSTFNALAFEDVDVPWQPTPDALWHSLLETYDIDRLSDGARRELQRDLLSAFHRLTQADGTIDTGFGLRLIHAYVL